MMSCEAALFDLMGSLIVNPVSASHSSCRFLLPCIYFFAMGSVVPDEIDSSGAYLLPDLLRKGQCLALPVIQESHDTVLSSSPLSTIKVLGHRGILFEAKQTFLW